LVPLGNTLRTLATVTVKRAHVGDLAEAAHSVDKTPPAPDNDIDDAVDAADGSDGAIKFDALELEPSPLPFLLRERGVKNDDDDEPPISFVDTLGRTESGDAG
jgi:hypothetical protein